MASLKERILLAPRLKRRQVEAAAPWLDAGEEVWARELTAAERLSLMETTDAETGPVQKTAADVRLMARAVALAACDAQGERLFADKDVEGLQRQSLGFLSAIWEVVAELSGFTAPSQEAVRKNSEAPTANGSLAG